MTVVVYIIGALLVLAGAVFISMGVPVVRLEIGWSEVIGGSVAGSAGFVILAVAVVLTRLEELRRAVLGLNVSAALRDAYVEREPAPAETWVEDPDRSFPPHPLAPSVHPVSDAPPAFVANDEPAAEAEALPVEEPLHAAAPDHAVAEEATVAESDVPAVEPDLFPEAGEGMHVRAPSLEAVPVDALAAAEEAGAPAAKPVPALPPLLRTRPNFLASFLARRSAQDRAGPSPERPEIEPPVIPRGEFEGDEPPVRTPVDLSSGWGEPEPAHHVPSGMAGEPALSEPAEPEPVPEALPEAPQVSEPEHASAAALAEPELPQEPHPAPEPDRHPEPASAAPEGESVDPLKPVVVGRYDAGSASYIMYSNGMIEVETESGTHQFASMQDLKAFIERRDAAKV